MSSNFQAAMGGSFHTMNTTKALKTLHGIVNEAPVSVSEAILLLLLRGLSVANS